MIGVRQSYPVNMSVDYPVGPRKRLTAFVRIVLIIPVMIIVGLLVGNPGHNPMPAHSGIFWFISSGFIIWPTMLMILFRQKYPAWWFAWNLHLAKFLQRVMAYLLLLRDEYPSTDQEQAVHVQLAYPDARRDLNRWLPLVKWLIVLPHYIVLALLSIIVVLVTLIAWFSILFTGRYPRDMFGFVVGALRWTLRVGAYAFILTTDHYPPFKLET